MVISDWFSLSVKRLVERATAEKVRACGGPAQGVAVNDCSGRRMRQLARRRRWASSRRIRLMTCSAAPLQKKTRFHRGVP